MIARRCVPLALSLLLALPGARAAPLDILGTRIDLPFDFEVADSSETLLHSRTGVTASQVVRIKPLDGAAGDERLVFAASYFSPHHPDARALAAELPRVASRAASQPGVRSSSTLRIDGSEFNVVAGTSKDKAFPQAIRWFGVVGDAVYSVQISAADAHRLGPPLTARIGAIGFDRATLEKTRARMDAESSVALREERMQTPIGDVTVPRDARFKLIESFLARNGAGEPVFRRRTFGFLELDDQASQTMRFPQIFSIVLGCGKQGALAPDDFDQFLQMTEERANHESGQLYSDFRIGGTQTLLGLASQTSRASGRSVDTWHLRHLDVRRWAAKKDGDWFMIAVNRFNGGPIENAMLAQLSTAPAVCRLDLPLGSGVPSGADPGAAQPMH